MARPDRTRVCSAALTGAATAVRDALVLNRDRGLEERHREEWPALWERIDRLMGTLDE